MSYSVVSLKDRYDLLDAHMNISGEVFPEFLLHAPVSDKYWMAMVETFKQYQLNIMDGEEILAAANSSPVFFDDNFSKLPNEGVEWALQKSTADHKAGIEPNILVGLQIMVRKDHQGKRLSSIVLSEMSKLAKRKGFKNVIIPVRPTQKEYYPLIPMEDYIQWENGNGLPFDSWLRVHVKAGGKILKPCEKSGIIAGTVNDWTKWTKQDFPGTGSYIISGALSPISIDIEKDKGVYVEPNVWVLHRT